MRTTREGRRDSRTTWHLETAQGEVPLPDVRCAEIDRRGRLVFTRGAGLFAARLVGGALVEQQLADFDAMRPERIESPPEAREWPST